MNSDNYIKFVQATINTFTINQLMDMAVNAMLEYERNSSDKQKALVINFCGMVMMKLSDQDITKVHETFKHFTAFNEITDITKKGKL